jgi:SAM-dependent methyltransferase
VIERAAIQSDFDEIARLADAHGHGSDRSDDQLLAQVPATARRVLDVGCGLGRLTARLAVPGREVVGVDLSPEMIARARRFGATMPALTFHCGDFLAMEFAPRSFDCVLSVAVLHHMPVDAAVARMVELLRPGGRLIIQDVRADQGLVDRIRSLLALAHTGFGRLVRTGRARSPRVVREAWSRHGAREHYLTLREAEAMASRLLPGSRVTRHWRWRYTIIWERPVNSSGAIP